MRQENNNKTKPVSFKELWTHHATVGSKKRVISTHIYEETCNYSKHRFKKMEREQFDP